MPRAYVIARVTVTNPEAYARYAHLASAAIAKFGGRILARGGRFEAFEGPARPRNVILEFASMDIALAYYHSPEYQAAKAERVGAGEVELCAVEGVD